MNPFPVSTEGMVKISGEYLGDLHCSAKHGPSGAVLETDAPVDNCGRGMNFSPTDLCATAIATCMATIMGIRADVLKLDLRGMRFEVEKEMSAQPPRRIARLTIHFFMPAGINEKQQQSLIRAANTCPVSLSLHPEIEEDLQFHWQ